MTDDIPLLGARFVRTFEPESTPHSEGLVKARTNPQDPTCSIAFTAMVPIEMTDIPECYLYPARDRYWDRLAQSSDPDEKAHCARMIDFINQAIGLLAWQQMDAKFKKRERELAAQQRTVARARWA